VRQFKTEVATLKTQLSISSATITKLRDDLRSKDFMIHEQQAMLDKEKDILRSLSDVGTHLKSNRLNELTEKANVKSAIN
jgi:hypothetical protein